MPRTTTITNTDGKTIYVDHWESAIRRLTNKRTARKSLDSLDLLKFIMTCETEEECEAVKKVFLSNMRHRKADIKRIREYNNMTNEEYILQQYKHDNR